MPLLWSPKSSLFFLLGLSSWGFYLGRALSGRVTELFYVGWIWSAILHAPCVLISPVYGLLVFVLSFAGLLAELRLVSATARANEALGSPSPTQKDSLPFDPKSAPDSSGTPQKPLE